MLYTHACAHRALEAGQKHGRHDREVVLERVLRGTPTIVNIVTVRVCTRVYVVVVATVYTHVDSCVNVRMCSLYCAMRVGVSRSPGVHAAQSCTPWRSCGFPARRDPGTAHETDTHIDTLT